MKIRLDQLLVNRGIAASREEAKRLILANKIRLAGDVAPKPGRTVDEDAEIESLGAKMPFVSRGGLKLAAALERFEIDATGALAMDVGASTGGFTDCLLQKGAARVVAVDTGKGKIHEKLRADPRVRLLENCNARGLTLDAAGGEAFDLIAIDVSFISLRLILPAMADLLKAEGSVVALVKPQFEAGRARVGRGGIVRDPATHEDVLRGLIAFARETAWRVRGVMPSPILGAEGNAEFFIRLSRANAPAEPEQETGIDGEAKRAVDEAARMQAEAAPQHQRPR